MSRFPSRRAIGIALLGLCAWSAGCGPGSVAVDAPAAQALLGPTPHASPRELLATPRAELARLFEEMAEQVQIRERAHRDGTLQFGLLPRLRLPLILPVWAEAGYSAKMEISLPPYIADGSKDNHLALHLARFGDPEAARRLAEPDDKTVLQTIDEPAGERNYPAEWTRLVALMLHTAEYRLAMGDDEGRAELASLHKEIRELLDAKAARGPLGAALLAQGHKVLSLAAAAWRAHSQPELADKADADLAAWGDIPSPVLAVPLGASSATVADMLRSQGKDQVVPALNTGRALDLFALPATREGAQAVIACFDAADKLAEVLVVYRPRIADYYLEPAHLVMPLEDHGVLSQDQPQIASVHRRDYTVGALTCQAAVVPPGYVLGAFVRFATGAGTPAPPALPRDFGIVNLDRSFGQNRVRLAPEQIGDVVQTTRAPILGKISNPLAPLAPTEAVLRRDGLFDVVKSFGISYSPEEAALFQTAFPLWSRLGPGRIEPRDDKNGGHLALQWQDSKTRFVLRLPHVSGQAFEFEVEDAQGPERLPARAAAAEELDRTERRARIEANAPLSRIPRRFEVGWSNPPGFVQLGMTRDQTLSALPRGQSIVKQNGPDFINVLLTGEPPRTATRVIRQVFVRFGPEQKAGEIRLCYFDGPAANSTSRWENELLTSLVKPCGAAVESLGPWSALWSDLPPRKPVPILARWQDDITLLTLQRDVTGAEAILRDCPLDQPASVALPPLAYLPRGPEGCLLGQEREDVLRHFQIDKPQTLADGALVLPPPRGGAYDALLVWLDKDKVTRIVARHVPPAAGGRESSSPGQQITQAWARGIRSLGWPMHQDAGSDGLQGLGWHDDQTRVRIFWQEGDNGPPRVFTEWKEVAEGKKQ